MALTSMMVFLALNGYVILATKDAAIEFAVRVASEPTDDKAISSWVRRHCVSVNALTSTNSEKLVARFGGGEENVGQSIRQHIAVLIKSIENLVTIVEDALGHLDSPRED